MSRDFLTGVFFLSLLAAVAGVPTAGAQPCPSPPPGHDDYFPMAVGQVWTYDWEEGWWHSHASGWRRGTLTLAVVGEVCSSEGATYTLTEHKEGLYVVTGGGMTDTTAVDEIRTISFTQSDGALAMPTPYLRPSVSVPRYLPVASPDSVRFEDVYRCGSGGFSQLRLTRGVGMVYHDYSCYGSGQYLAGTLQLQGVPLPNEDGPSSGEAFRLEVYPSLATTAVTVRVSGLSPEAPSARLSLLDVSGRMVREDRAVHEGEARVLSLVGLASGTYFVRAATASETAVARFTVAR